LGHSVQLALTNNARHAILALSSKEIIAFYALLCLGHPVQPAQNKNALHVQLALFSVNLASALTVLISSDNVVKPAVRPHVHSVQGTLTLLPVPQFALLVVSPMELIVFRVIRPRAQRVQRRAISLTTAVPLPWVLPVHALVVLPPGDHIVNSALRPLAQIVHQSISLTTAIAVLLPVHALVVLPYSAALHVPMQAAPHKEKAAFDYPFFFL